MKKKLPNILNASYNFNYTCIINSTWLICTYMQVICSTAKFFLWQEAHFASCTWFKNAEKCVTEPTQLHDTRHLTVSALQTFKQLPHHLVYQFNASFGLDPRIWPWCKMGSWHRFKEYGIFFMAIRNVTTSASAARWRNMGLCDTELKKLKTHLRTYLN